MTLFHIYRLFVTTRAILLLLVWPLLVESALPSYSNTDFESRGTYSLSARTHQVVHNAGTANGMSILPAHPLRLTHLSPARLIAGKETGNDATRICIDHRRSRSPGTVRHLSR
jgi:hypothetical protein